MQRVKNIDYDEDDLYSEEEEDGGEDDGYSQEDKDNFATLTPVVRAELDEAGVPVTTQQIEDALWHYYWDVGKSVAYLKNSRTPREGKKESKKDEKPKSKFDQAAEKAGELRLFSCSSTQEMENGVMEGGLYDTGGQSIPHEVESTSDHVLTVQAPLSTKSAADWFRDTPWTNVPADMLGQLVPTEPEPPRIKLLGGSSKLAKLAEERRKKAAAAAQPTQTAAAPDSTSSLDRLAKPKDIKENVAPTSKAEPKKYAIRRKRSPTPPPKEPTPPPEEPKEQLPDLRTSPSAFGRTLSAGSAHSSNTRQMALQDLLGSSYAPDPFEGPSPDDTVMRAQDRSKGLNK